MNKFFLVIAAVCTSGLSHADLMGYYTFDDGTARDLSGHGRNGTLGSVSSNTIAPEYDPSLGVTGGSFRFHGWAQNQGMSIDLPIDIGTASMPVVTIGLWVRVSSNWYTGSYQGADFNPFVGDIVSSDNGGFDRGLSDDPRGGSTASGYPWQIGAFAGNNGFIGSGSGGGGGSLTGADSFHFLVMRQNQLTGDFSLTQGFNGSLVSQGRSGVFYDGSSKNFMRLGDSASNNIWDERFDGWMDNVFVYNQWVSDADLRSIYESHGSRILTPEPVSMSLGIAAVGLFLRRRRGKSGI